MVAPDKRSPRLIQMDRKHLKRALAGSDALLYRPVLSRGLELRRQSSPGPGSFRTFQGRVFQWNIPQDFSVCKMRT